MPILTTKTNVLLIASELAGAINGTPQTTRCFINNLVGNTLTVEGREYIYELQPGDNVLEIIAGLKVLIDADPEPIVEVVNTQSSYLDIRGILTQPFDVTLPAVSQTIVEASPDDLWELFALDVDDTVSEDTFKAEIEKSQRYLMAHLFAMNDLDPEQGTLSSETVGSVSVGYQDPLSASGLSMTKYGIIYKQLLYKNRRIRFT